MTRRAFGTRIGTSLVAAAAVAQVASEKVATPSGTQDITGNEISPDLITPDVKRVGSRLRCLCGCAMTVGECNMVGCHYASPARTRIHEMLKSGMTDDQIVDTFVKEEGIKVLAAPPAKGFNWFGYSAPYILAALGAGFVALFIKRMRKPAEPAPTAVPIEPATLSKYEAAAAKDIADLED
jgi:cytochrome c-type biogenesis protein CcmH/NrfF